MIVKGMISNYSSFKRMNTGRVVFSLVEMHKVAITQKKDEVVYWLQKALHKGRTTMRVEFAYNQTRDKTSRARGNAVELVNILDKQISAIQSVV